MHVVTACRRRKIIHILIFIGMKKLLFAIVAFFAAAPSFAQFSSGGFSLDEEHLYWGVRFGVNFSSISGDLKADEGRTGMTLGGVVGLRVTDSSPVFLESGLYYTQRGANKLEGFQTADVPNVKSFDGHLNYLEVPVLIKYGVTTENNIAILPFLGPYFSYCVAGDTDYLKRPDMGFKVGCGVEWNNLYLEALYQFGVVNICDYNNKGDFSSHGNAFGINLGINF